MSSFQNGIGFRPCSTWCWGVGEEDEITDGTWPVTLETKKEDKIDKQILYTQTNLILFIGLSEEFCGLRPFLLSAFQTYSQWGLSLTVYSSLY